MRLTERELDHRLKSMHPASYSILNRNPIWAKYGSRKFNNRAARVGLTKQTCFPWMKIEIQSGEIWYSEDGEIWESLCWTED